MTPYGTHLPALIAAVLYLNGDVVEMGSGHFSTPILHEILKNTNRKLYTYDHDAKWLDNFLYLETKNHTLKLVQNWDDIIIPKCDILFIDHAPALQRQKDIIKYKTTPIIVVHDTEDKTYKYDFSSFKYKYIYDVYKIRTTLISNSINVTNII